MNFQFVFRVLILSSIFQLAGCSVFFGDDGIFRGRSKDYLRTGDIKPVEVPEGMSSRTLESEYYIPAVKAVDEFGDPVQLLEYEVPQPEAIASDKESIGVKIQKLAGKRWIFLDAPTSRVWPRAQSFLSQFGVETERSNARSGLIETAWLKFKDDPDNYSKFKVLIEKGIHPQTTEIRVVQVQRVKEKLQAEAIDWPEASDNPERESILLNELAGALAESINDNTASLMGQNVGGVEKAGFRVEGSEPVLSLSLPLVRARATVAHSLTKEGYALWGEDAETGLYYVGYLPPVEDEGFWGWMWPDEKLPKKPRYTLKEITQHLADTNEVKSAFAHIPSVGYGSPLKKAQGYLVITSLQDGQILVKIRDHRGQPLPRAQAKAQLRVIRRNLI
ncbi:outer membrane protein assembly factor BamC [Teredinibacter sp. KSP-S5-2]|uniref:outer membrane protein assembly factor BamC n=1 Tax=Teredinibacter sp. KSP-S5-2 TaxID=3034506 RepID=UPI0029347B0A|nr:outer membrane protein assembly factor BamC [Teredinibacter sp. KSP-S5-2]WNO09809.1 outer membrane protein assembly factor BamC [Teredinibacter sp. KSP-S5-2]